MNLRSLPKARPLTALALAVTAVALLSAGCASRRTPYASGMGDAEMARLEILNEAIDGVFKDIPARHMDFFDRGVSGGAQPRLWLDAITHVAMGNEKRT